VNEHEPSEILSDEEYSALCNEIGEESDGMADQEDLVSKLRSKIQQRRNEVFENTMNEIKIRSTYEEGVSFKHKLHYLLLNGRHSEVTCFIK